MNVILPLVTIVTPNYNGMPYLKFNIDSVRSQDYPNLEHIVIDGASSDKSVALLNSYFGITWISEKDGGQSQALNKGFSLANGEIIGWLNSDDTYTDGTIFKAVRFLIDNPEIDLIGTDVNIIDEYGVVFGIAKGKNTTALELLSKNVIKQPSIFMRRRVIETLKGVNESLHFIMDQELWIRALMNGFHYAYLPNEIFANFRLVKGTKTFESAPEFIKEWHNCKINLLKKPFFNFLNVKEYKQILNKSYFDLHFSKMILAIQKKELVKVLEKCFFCVLAYPRILTNGGFIKIFLLGLLGKEHNRIKKFQMNFNEYK
jgi:glycosyltransferase involved in cell wall biosynthesis